MIVKTTAFHPRNAPMHAMNFTSPKPIASRGSVTSRTSPRIDSTFTSSHLREPRCSHSHAQRTGVFSKRSPSISIQMHCMRICSLPRKKKSLHSIASAPTTKSAS